MMQLQTGAAAPLFETVDANGDTVRLEDYRGGNLLLAFFRNAACALCNLRVRDLMQQAPEWERQGLRVLTVFESPQASIAVHVGQQQPPFPIVADPDAVLYELYGVENSAAKVAATVAAGGTAARIAAAAEAGFALTREESANFDRMPAEFLIGPDLTVLHAHYASLITDHLATGEIEGIVRLHPALAGA
jgi:peroxiredoxin Q/BCP